MTERPYPNDEDAPELSDLDDAIQPELDLDLGSDTDVSGGDDLAELDEENLYGNDVIVNEDEE